MLNKYFYQHKAKLYQNFKNITLLKIPLTQFLGCRNQGKGPSPTNTWQAYLNIYLKTSLTFMQMISGKHTRSHNTVLHVRKTCWAPTRSTPRSYTSLPRCGPAGLIQKQSRENLGFPLKNMIMKIMKNIDVKIISPLFSKSKIHAMSSKTWTWAPILENHARTNTKTWIQA